MKCNIKNYLPDVVKEIGDFVEINNSLGQEICFVQLELKDIDNQHTFDTMTWGIDTIEKEFGIDNSKLPMNQRIEIIKARLRGRGTTTIKMIKDTAEAFSGGDVDIIEQYNKYHFVVKFVGTLGVPENLDEFRKTIELIKPAHLSYSLEYTYLTWGHIKNTTWEDLKNYTWKQVMESGDIIGG